MPRTYVISDVISEEIVGTFYRRELQKMNQKEFRVEKIIKRKDDKVYLTWKGYNSSFNSWIDKKDIIWMNKCFRKSKSFGGRVKVELDLSIYATKDYLKNATGVDTSDFAKKTDLTNLRFDVGKLDIDKLKNVPSCLNSLESKANKLDVEELVPAPADLSKLSEVVKMMSLKRLNMMNCLKNLMLFRLLILVIW